VCHFWPGGNEMSPPTACVFEFTVCVFCLWRCVFGAVCPGRCFPSIFVPQVRAVAPGIAVGKILIQRDESSPEKLPQMFYCKLPPAIKVRLCVSWFDRRSNLSYKESEREIERERRRE
jgi:hypothetical protein